MDRIIIAILTNLTRTSEQREADLSAEIERRKQNLLRNWGNNQ